MIIKKLYDKIFYYEDILDSPEEFVISIEKSENLLRPDSTIQHYIKMGGVERKH